jgi:hypothetical protein
LAEDGLDGFFLRVGRLAVAVLDAFDEDSDFGDLPRFFPPA